MAVAILMAIITAVVGGLALLSQWAKKNRGAEIALWVVLLFSSLGVLLIGLVAALGLTALSGTADGPDIPASLALVTGGVLVVAGVLELALCVPPLRRMTGRGQGGSSFWADPVIFFAAWIFVLVMANNVTNFLLFGQIEDFSALVQGLGGGRISPQLVLVNQLPFVVIAALGVGIGVRRGLRQTLSRLGFGPISLPQLGVVALFIVGALALSAVSNAVFASLQPDLYERVGEISGTLFGTQGLSLMSAVLFGLLVGVGAALGEETLFRGAVQPVFGIVATSVIFASLHPQYGFSVALGFIFVVGIALGVLRERVNTTASFLAHAGFNFTGVMLAYFGASGI